MPKTSAATNDFVIIYYSLVKIIPSTASITNLSTKFNFRNYHFLILFITLSAIVMVILVYIDLGYFVTLINRVFLLKHALEIYIHIIISPISVRDIGINHYSISEYILLDMYLLGRYNDKEVRAKLTRKIYIVDNLKAKILLEIDIINLEKINIITSKNKVYIGLYDITVIINLKPRSRDVTIKPIVASKQATLSSYS